MTNPGSLISLAISVLLLWVYWYFALKPLLVAWLRQELFEIRDELFDYAAAGGVPFEHAAYVRLRRLFNTIIRFAHDISLLRLVITRFSSGDSAATLRTFEDYLSPINTLDPSQKLTLLRFHSRLLLALFRFMVLRNPLALLVFGFYVAWLLFCGYSRSVSDSWALAGHRTPGIIETEARAVSIDNLAHSNS